MSHLAEVMSMMAAPTAVLLMLRGNVIRQNRLAEAAERIEGSSGSITATSGRAGDGMPARE